MTTVRVKQFSGPPREAEVLEDRDFLPRSPLAHVRVRYLDTNRTAIVGLDRILHDRPAPPPGQVVRPVHRGLVETKARAVERERPVRSRSYLAWLRERPCAFCGAMPPSEVSHHGKRGTGTKASDLDALPACRPCHDRHHRRGRAHASLDALTTDQYRERLAFMAGQVRETHEGAA